MELNSYKKNTRFFNKSGASKGQVRGSLMESVKPLIPYLRKCEAVQLLEVLVFLELVGFFTVSQGL